MINTLFPSILLICYNKEYMVNSPWFTSLRSTLAYDTFVLIGLGREGRSSYLFLRELTPQANFILIDDQPLARLNEEWQRTVSQDAAIFMTTEQALRHTSSWATPNSLIIKTPGLPLHHPLTTFVHRQQLSLTSNTDLLYQALNQLPMGQVKIIGITGTKGKSTTTSFIHHLLLTSGQTALVGGNIGVPALDLLPQVSSLLSSSSALPIWIVLEQSCHQLDDLRRSPNVAIIQHIVPEHLDYYPDFARYLSSKSSIARYQTTEDLVLASSDSPTASQLAKLSAGTWLDTQVDAWLSDTNAGPQLILRKTQQPLCTLTELPLKGRHNLANITPGLALAEYLTLDPKQVATALRSFKPLPHRLQPVATLNGVEYINDSLATVPDAAVAALSAFAHKPTVLLAGGYERHQDFTPLAEWIVAHGLRGLVLFAPTGHRLEETLRQLTAQKKQPLDEIVPHLEYAHHMSEAVTYAKAWAVPGDVVLLSPGSASFGEFKDYADRGNQFAQQVQART